MHANDLLCNDERNIVTWAKIQRDWRYSARLLLPAYVWRSDASK